MRLRERLIGLAFILAVWPATVVWSGEAATQPVRARFGWLRVGEVKPRGWLLEQLRNDVRYGFASALDRLTDRCDLNTFDTRNKLELTQPKIGGVWWNGETTGNWLDGFIRMAYLSGDAQAKTRADAMVTRVLATQDEDGYLGCYPRKLRYQQPIGQPNNGELWDQACLFRGLLAYYELTGREEVLKAVHRAALLTVSKYGKDRPYWDKGIPRGGPGHNLMFVDVCEWLHRLTGDSRYVEFASFLYDTYNEREDVFERDILLRNMADMSKLFNGHGAHAMEHLRVPFFVYYATGDEKYRVAVENALVKTARHTSACGACISDEDILQRTATPYIANEHCTNFELLNSLQSAVQKTGRAEWADWIERSAYNAAEAFRLRDGKALQYFMTDNQYEASRKRGHGSRYKLSPTHEDVAVCCPPTGTKIFPYLVNHLWMREAGGNGLVAVVYAPSLLETAVGEVPVTIETETNYPFEERVRMVVRPKIPARFTIRLRVPAWAETTEVTAAGAETRSESGWKILSKVWSSGDTISVSFAPKIERKAESNGEVYWQRGPLVYALPIPSQRAATKQYPVEGFFDWDYTPQAGASWDYAMGEGCGDFVFQQTQADVARRNWETPGLCLTGHLFNRATNRKEEVQLVPMASSLLRRTAFTDMKRVRLLMTDANLARKAKVEASSESPGFSARGVNDGVADGFPPHPEAEWASKKETTGAKVTLTWDKPVTIEDVWLFDRPNPFDHVKNAWINFSDGSSAIVDELPDDGLTPFRLIFPEKTITWMEVIVTRVGPRCRNAGFSEIAVFAKEPDETTNKQAR